ncbi:hypothetical protein QF049_004840 [Paenibacillus sp. W4I10]|uniref:hypothetical protein n=1 Tax=Paenibacillus sp. W4I10 TaxID=3042298 RepID=UPI002785A151|nr:hypothetical protein [Paenibacillus sp. W4I10]MDQ0723579.1 hypothetical protein [Paenibacillus sp. W4I10]
MSIVRRLSLLPVIMLLFTLGCTEKSVEQVKEKPHVRGIIKDFEEERGQVLIENKEDGGVESGPILISLSKNAELIIEGQTVTVSLDETLVGRSAEVWINGVIAQSYPPQTKAVKMVIH